MFTESLSPGWKTVGSDGKAIQVKSSNKPKTMSAAKLEDLAKKNFLQKAPKLEDVVPAKELSKLNTFALNTKKKNASPPAAASAKTKDSNANASKSPKSAKSQTVPEKKAVEKEKKPEVPKTFEEAVKKMSCSAFKESVAQIRAANGSELFRCVYDAAIDLNGCLALKDNKLPASLFEPLKWSPLSKLHKEVQQTIRQLVSDWMKLCEADSSIYNGFYILMSELDTFIRKGRSVWGYLIVLEAVCEARPTACLHSTQWLPAQPDKYKEQSAVMSAFFWVASCAGKKDLSAGFRVWLQLMMPMLGHKCYADFERGYLAQLLQWHYSQKAQLRLTGREFITLIDALFPVSPVTVNAAAVSKLRTGPFIEIKEAFMSTCSADQKFLLDLLQRLEKFTDAGQTGDDGVAQLASCVWQWLSQNPAQATKCWSPLYPGHLMASAVALHYLDDQWSQWERLSKNQHLISTIQHFEAQNATLPETTKGLTLAKKCCKNLLNRMVRPEPKRQKTSWSFPWAKANGVLLLLIGCMVYYDVQNKGSYKASNVGHFLQDVGLYQPSEQLLTYGHHISLGVMQELEHRLPNGTRQALQPVMDGIWQVARGAQEQALVLKALLVTKVEQHGPQVKEWLQPAWLQVLAGCDSVRHLYDQHLSDWVQMAFSHCCHGAAILRQFGNDAISGKNPHVNTISNFVQRATNSAWDWLDGMMK